MPRTLQEFYPAPLNRWYEAHVHPGEEGISVFFRDITQAVQIQQTMKLHQQAIESVPVGISIAAYSPENDYPLIYANPAFEQLQAIQQRPFLGKTVAFPRARPALPAVPRIPLCHCGRVGGNLTSQVENLLGLADRLIRLARRRINNSGKCKRYRVFLMGNLPDTPVQGFKCRSGIALIYFRATYTRSPFHWTLSFVAGFSQLTMGGGPYISRVTGTRCDEEKGAVGWFLGRATDNDADLYINGEKKDF